MDIEIGVLTGILFVIVSILTFAAGCLFGYAITRSKMIDLQIELIELKQKLSRK